MNTHDRADRSSERRPFYTRMLYWMAIAMAPEAALFPMETGRALEQRAELMRTAERGVAANQEDGADSQEAA